MQASDVCLDMEHQSSSTTTATPASSSVAPINTYKPSTNSPKSIILFDGVCNVCDGFVQFVYPRDTEGRFSFQALQSVKGREILNYYGIASDLSTIVLVEEETQTYYTKSTAVLRIMYHLKKPYPVLSYFTVIPGFIRDFCYSTFANYRYLIMGKKDFCMFSPALRDRFVDFRSPLIEDNETKEM
eukprot:gene9644-11825_t